MQRDCTNYVDDLHCSRNMLMSFGGCSTDCEHYQRTDKQIHLTGNETTNELLDYMVLKICRTVAEKKAFKSSWMLTKLLQSNSRMTKDIDLSVANQEAYFEVKAALKEIADDFIAAGVITDYKIKEDISSAKSGGIDLYRGEGKFLGVDVGLHEITWGVRRYELSIVDLDAFEIERMLADKIIAILSVKRFRRTKDLYDLYILAHSFDFDLKKLREYIDRRGGAAWNNIPFSDSDLEKYRNAWDKLQLINSSIGEFMEKFDFDVYLRIFYAVVLPLKSNTFQSAKWNHFTGMVEAR